MLKVFKLTFSGESKFVLVINDYNYIVYPDMSNVDYTYSIIHNYWSLEEMNKLNLTIVEEVSVQYMLKHVKHFPGFANLEY